MQAQRETVGFNIGTRGSRIKGARVNEKPTLAEVGIDKNTAHRARRQAAQSKEEFEADIAKKKASITGRKRKRKAANTPPAARSAAKGKIIAPYDSKSWISHIDIISAWNGAPPAERTKAMHGIGLKSLLTVLPLPWIPLIEKWLVELKAEAPNSEIAEQTTKVGDSLDIPDFLRRDKWLKAEAVE